MPSWSRLLLAVGLLLCALPAQAELEPIPHRILDGETARRIAARHGLSLAELEELNPGIDLDRLRAGRTIFVGRGRRIRHRVREGETVGGLAERYGVRREDLSLWNPTVARRGLQAGSELEIWATRDEPPSESVGRPDAGSLVHGVRLPPHPGYEIHDPERAWTTREVAEVIVRAFDDLRDRHPTSPRLEIRDASRRNGGPMREHRSHQSGRDVDFTYFRQRCPAALCAHAWLRPEQLDANLLWELVGPWIRSGTVEYVFLDHDLQAPMREAARAGGARPSELSAWFQWPRASHERAGIVRHVPRHTEHFHVRFACAARDTSCVGGTAGD